MITGGEKQKILFVCELNAGRTQMAEGFLNALYGDRFVAYSAGISPSVISPLTVRVMKESGIDITHQTSKSIEIFRGDHFDRIFLLCSWEPTAIPVLPKSGTPAIPLHFSDPKSWQGDDDEILRGFRTVRDEIGQWIQNYFGSPGY
jgi:arsenate reductase